jgi:hypothetical protein
MNNKCVYCSKKLHGYNNNYYCNILQDEITPIIDHYYLQKSGQIEFYLNRLRFLLIVKIKYDSGYQVYNYINGSASEYAKKLKVIKDLNKQEIDKILNIVMLLK